MSFFKVTFLLAAVLSWAGTALGADTTLVILWSEYQGDNPITNATVTITGPTSLVRTTDVAGRVSFGDIPIGTYAVTVVKAGVVNYTLPGVSITQTAVTQLAFDPFVSPLGMTLIPPRPGSGGSGGSGSTSGGSGSGSCASGYTCNFTPITGTVGQSVCGSDVHVWSCTSTGWIPTGTPCTCDSGGSTTGGSGGSGTGGSGGTTYYPPSGYVQLTSAEAAMNLTGTVSNGNYGLGLARGWAGFRNHQLLGAEQVVPSDEQWATPDIAAALLAAIPQAIPYPPPGYVLLSKAAAILNLTGAISNGSYGVGLTRGWVAFRNGVYIDVGSVQSTDQQFATADVAYALEAAAQPVKDITGWIDGVFPSGGSTYLMGWACAKTAPQSIAVHLYAGGAAGGGGTFVTATTANIASEPAVATACNSIGSAYRFQILLDGYRFQFAGKKLFVHGISPFGLSNLAISNSGTWLMPAPIAVFRPSGGNWYSYGEATRQWGTAGDIPVAGDYDGDGRKDYAVFRPSSGTWYTLYSSSNYQAWGQAAWGAAGDIPVPGDYDGDHKTDYAVWRPSTGTWYVSKSSTQYSTYYGQQWGLPGDIPVPGDYDGDGRTDMAVWRPSNVTWYILTSSSNFTSAITRQFGIPTDIPVPGDYDNDGKVDLAVYRPSSGTWFISKSSTGFTTTESHVWGVAGDIPIPGDYNGDGKTDIAVFRPSDGTWWIWPSGKDMQSWFGVTWGGGADIPVPRP